MTVDTPAIMGGALSFWAMLIVMAVLLGIPVRTVNLCIVLGGGLLIIICGAAAGWPR